MSTKRKKIYCAEDIKFAQEETKRSEGYFTRRTSRRRTVQVRIGEKWHQKIKEVAGSEKIMLSFFLDRICQHFFRNYE